MLCSDLNLLSVILTSISRPPTRTKTLARPNKIARPPELKRPLAADVPIIRPVFHNERIKIPVLFSSMATCKNKSRICFLKMFFELHYSYETKIDAWRNNMWTTNALWFAERTVVQYQWPVKRYRGNRVISRTLWQKIEYFVDKLYMVDLDIIIYMLT